MDALDVIGLLVVGWCGGMLGGLVGVGGGVLFVPGLVIFLGLSQLEAEATSLLAIVFVAAVGAWRQHGYGNLRPRDALWIGVLSPLGVVAGTWIANAVERARARAVVRRRADLLRLRARAPCVRHRGGDGGVAFAAWLRPTPPRVRSWPR